MSSGRFVDLLAGCVVGGALVAVGMFLAKKNQSQLHVTMLKDDSAALVWQVDSEGQAKFVSYAMIPPERAKEMARDGARRLGELLASTDVNQMMQDTFGAMAEGAAKAKMRGK